MTRKAGTGGTWPSARESGSPERLQEARADSPRGSPEGTEPTPCRVPGFRLQNREQTNLCRVQPLRLRSHGSPRKQVRSLPRNEHGRQPTRPGQQGHSKHTTQTVGTRGLNPPKLQWILPAPVAGTQHSEVRYP